jgi:hypothetical protein
MLTSLCYCYYNFIDCWKHEPCDRPTIHEVVTRLEAIMKKNNNTNGFRSYDYNTDVQQSISNYADFYSCNSNINSHQQPISSFAKDFYSCNSNINSHQQSISSFAKDFYSCDSSISSQRLISSSRRINFDDDEEIEQTINVINNSL